MSRPAVIIRGVSLYLVPKALGCASVCWKQPKVTVVSTAHLPMVAVRLPDELGGRVVEIHEDNLTTRLPEPPKRTFRTRKPMTGGDEIPLW